MKNLVSALFLSLGLAGGGVSAQTAESLSVDSVSLGEVVITARPVEAVVSAGKISFNPAATLAAEGGGALDAIASMPGVTVDASGAISVNGRPDVSVVVDGRKGVLRGDAQTAYLRSLPVSAIHRIEISTVPSAGRDASDSPTVINVRLKPRRDDGFGLSLTANARALRGCRGFGNFFATYSGGPAYITLSGSLMGARNPSMLSTVRPYPGSDIPLTQDYRRTRRDNMDNLALTAVFDFASGYSGGLSLTCNGYDRRESSAMHTLLPAAPVPETTLNHTRFDSRNIYGSAYLKKALPSPDSHMTLCFDFFSYRGTERQALEGDSGGDLDGGGGGNTRGYAGTYDYAHTLSASFRISLGAKFSVVDMTHGGRYTGLENVDSDFGYIEDVEALYAEGALSMGRVALMAGLRGERAGMRTRFSGNEAEASRLFGSAAVSLYPSASVIFTPGGGDSFSLSYAKRVSRPKYSDLNPFIHIYDDITHIGGNISLRPAVSHSLSLEWASGGWLRLEAAGSYVSNDIERCFRELTDRVVYVSPENLPRHVSGSLTASAVGLNPFSWLSASATVSVVCDSYRFPASTGIAPVSSLMPMAQARLMFSLPSGWKAELSGNFHGRMARGQAMVAPGGMMYVGLRKAFLGGKANLTLFVRDLLDTSRRRSSIMLSGRKATLVEREYEDMRRIGLSLSLRLSHGPLRKSAPSPRNNLKEEINRVNL